MIATARNHETSRKISGVRTNPTHWANAPVHAFHRWTGETEVLTWCGLTVNLAEGRRPDLRFDHLSPMRAGELPGDAGRLSVNSNVEHVREVRRLLERAERAEAALAQERAARARAEAALRTADSLLDCTEFALEWFFEKFDDPKHFKCDCSEDGGYMEYDTNAYIHTERCSSGRDDSLGALKDQIGQWRAALAAGGQDGGGEGVGS